jgi:HK97 family phage portal protein
MASLRQRIARWIAPAETRASTFYAPAVGFGPSLGGTVINTVLAENLSTVTACVNAIASGLASLPARVYRTQGEGRIEVPGHPVARLLRQPNARQTWPDFLEWLLGSTLLNGNGLAAIEYDGRGQPVALLPIPWSAVQVVALPTGRLAFDVVSYQTPWGGSGQPRRYLDTEVLHLKDRSDDGWLGRSRISRAPDVLGAAIGLQTYSTAIWNNQATPSGMVTLPANITPEGKKRAEAFFEDRMVGAANARRVLYADKDTTWQGISVSPEDAEVLASRRFSGEEIARLFNVPPPIIGDLSHGTFTNSETAGRWFAQFTLSPWANKLEAEFSRSVFADPSGTTHMEIDLSGIMRGDYAARWTANVAAVGAGILTADEVREQEGFNPLPAGAKPATPAVAAAADPGAPDPAMADCADAAC